MKFGPLILLTALLAVACEPDEHKHEHEHAQDSERPAAPGDQAEQSRGRDLYARHGCAGCHGMEGRGDGPAAAELPNKPRDFRDRGGYKRGASLDEINRTLRTGIKGSVMIGYDHLPEVERKLLARYVVFLQSRK